MKKLIFTPILLAFVMPFFAQETFKIPEMTLNQKYDQTSMNLEFSLIVGIDYAKSNGKTAADYGKYMGSKIAPSWDKSAGFNGFVNGGLYNLISFHNEPEAELMINTPDKVKVKMHLMVQWLKKEGKIMNVTYQDYMDSFSAIFNEIAIYMGAKFEYSYDDNWMYVTFSKK